MIALLSPAKKLALPKDLTGLPPALLNSKPSPFSQPQLQHESTVLVDILKKKSAKEISTLMSISEKLSTQNHARWQMWQPTPKTVQLIGNQKFFPAGYLFQGDVYQGLDLKSLTVAEVKKLNELVYILSGLYGALRLLDLIMPYRLEMGTELKNPRGKNLLYYWEDQVAKLITKNFEQTSSNKIILNLASEEYFNVIKMYLPSDITVIQPLFYDEIKGNYKMVSFYAKKARGLMVRYLAKTWSVGKTKSLSNTLSYLKAFNLEKYYFSEASKKSAPCLQQKPKLTIIIYYFIEIIKIMELETFISAAIYGAALIGSPGPAVISLFQSGINYGFKKTMPYFTGILLGYLLNQLASAVALFSAVKISPVFYEIAKVIALMYIATLVIK